MRPFFGFEQPSDFTESCIDVARVVQRTLAEYGILEDTVLEVAPQTAKEGEERSAQAGALVLRAALAVEAASRMRAAVELHMGTERMMLCNADGTGKSWGAKRMVWPGPAGYADIVALNATHVGVLYEAGDKTFADRIQFSVVRV